MFFSNKYDVSYVLLFKLVASKSMEMQSSTQGLDIEFPLTPSMEGSNSDVNKRRRLDFVFISVN